MEIRSKIKDREGRVFDVVFKEKDPMIGLQGVRLEVVQAFCFCEGKLVLVYAKEKDRRSPPGGSVEEGESPDEAVVREVFEETNMEVLHKELIGYQDIYLPDETVRQVRYFCKVRPLGDFVSDPDGDITEIKLIDPSEYKEYFDWGEIGEYIMKKSLNF